MTAMIFDVTEFRSPRAYRLGRQLARRAMVHRLGRNARIITTMTESTASDLRSVLHLSPERVVVIGTGIDSWPVAKVCPWGERERALVYVGGMDPNKRLDLVVEALATIPNLRLKIISAGGAAEQSVRKLARARGVTDRIEWLGRLGDTEARQVVAASVALVLASDFEGFGLPILESLQVGTPVVISSTLPFASEWERVGGPVFRAGDAADLSRATRGLLDDPGSAAQLCNIGPRLVENYTWPGVARRLDGVFRSVLRLPSNSVN
jgi:glycosyltransferase involved in cell wall biosynthesis